jgi:hypothetical protein
MYPNRYTHLVNLMTFFGGSLGGGSFPSMRDWKWGFG